MEERDRGRGNTRTPIGESDWGEGMGNTMKWNRGIALWLAVGMVACAPEATQESGGMETLSGAKGDCPTCDEAGPGAMEQAGISERFYVKGDAWIIAYQRTSRHDMAMEPVLNVEESELPLGAGVQSNRDRTPLFLFNYQVDRVYRSLFPTLGGKDVLREIASIIATPGDATNAPVAELFIHDDFTQLEPKLAFEMNDLLDPISETLYSKEYPNGKRIPLAGKSRLRTGSSIFPHSIPRALVAPTYVLGKSIEISPELETVLDVTNPDWREKTYLSYRFEGLGEVESQGDKVYWEPGTLWPFLIETDQGTGVLLRFISALPQNEVEGGSPS